MGSTLRACKVKLFLTCWVIFVLHFATDFSREHYLVLSMVDDCTFQLDKYVGLHADIFVTEGHGAHHGANPGASMVAAIPYYVFKPLCGWIIDRFSKSRETDLETEDKAVYKDHRPARVKFYQKARKLGLDIKMGLVGLITMAFCMAPLSALGGVFMFDALHRTGLSRRVSVWMAVLYAFGTPIFFRTAYLNQNLLVGNLAFMGFILLWRQDKATRRAVQVRMAVSGFLGGLCFLSDYSGLIPLVMLYGYGVLRLMDSAPFGRAAKDSLWYLWGAIGPVLLLWFYQWSSFGHPFYPPQHFMPPQTYSDVGYQGIRFPSGELLGMLLFDARYGLFVVSPVLLLGLFSLILNFRHSSIVPLRETFFVLAFFAGMIVFFSSVEYTRLQWVTGIRYIVPVIPFLFLPTAAVMVRMPRVAAYGLSTLALGSSWAMSMARRGVGVPEESMLVSIKSVLTEGLQLPWLNTLSKMGIHYVPFVEHPNLTALFLFVLCAVILYGIWRFGRPCKGPKNMSS